MKKTTSIFSILTIAVALLTWIPATQALPTYPSVIGMGVVCGTCHVNPAGGGPRNADGMAFEAIPTHMTDPAGAWAMVVGGGGDGGTGNGMCGPGEMEVCVCECVPDGGMPPPPPDTVQGCIFNPPSFHNEEQDGCLHAPGHDMPFTNGCTSCHGANLQGGANNSPPSCFTCHDMEWDEEGPITMPPPGTVQGCRFNPPSFHNEEQDDCLHAPGHDRPFTNGCTSCHGANLQGGANNSPPSCFTCHDMEWDERGPGMVGDDDDDDKSKDD